MGIYLDHNAGAPLRPEVRAALARIAEADLGNPASVHRPGQHARRALEQARAQVAALLDADPRQIIFTSGGTESNNLAIFGAVRAASHRRRIVSSAIEHSSILAPLAELESRGLEVLRIAPDADGRLPASRVIAAIESGTALVTLGLANAEVGTIQDLSGVASAAEVAGAVFHVDAAQAAGRLPVSVRALGCDLMTISGHKLGAPAGIGALYVRKPLALTAFILGGPQEGGLRAGTPNVAGAVGLGAAAEAVGAALSFEAPRIAALSRELVSQLCAAIPGLKLNGPSEGRIANTLNLIFPGVIGESLLIALDLEGVHVSMGSACAAGAVEPSHVLIAMGRSANEARSSLRLSLGWNTTAEEVAQAARIIPRVWRRVAECEPAGQDAEAPG